MTFDVSIDLTDAVLSGAALRDDEAASRVRAAVEAIPGANWVSVEVHHGAPSSLPWVAVYPPGRGAAACGGIRRRVEQAVRAALA